MLGEKKHDYEYKGTQLEEIVRRPNSMLFIQEPTDDKYLSHVNDIKTGNLEGMDFADLEFKRNIYKALRKEGITVDEAATALILQAAVDEFKNLPKSHSYTEKGPYSIGQNKHATAEDIQEFKQKLKQLPVHEQSYYTIGS